MVRLTRITTRTGDGGETSLGDGSRAPKTDPRFEAMGAVDELNAALGMARRALWEEGEKSLGEEILKIQNDLFDLGADLSVPTADKKKRLRIEKKHWLWLEKAMEPLLKDLAPLRSFILPGGTKSASWLHIARTLARRAERRMLSLQGGGKKGGVNEAALIYMNRLSDYLFCAARFANAKGKNDVLWKPGGKSKKP